MSLNLALTIVSIIALIDCFDWNIAFTCIGCLLLATCAGLFINDVDLRSYETLYGIQWPELDQDDDDGHMCKYCGSRDTVVGYVKTETPYTSSGSLRLHCNGCEYGYKL